MNQPVGPRRRNAAARLGAAALALPRCAVERSQEVLKTFDLRDRSRPTARSRLRLVAEAVMDETAMAAYRMNVVDHPPHIVEEILAGVHEAVALFERRGWLDAPQAYFADPPPLLDPQITREWVGRLQIERLQFPSEYTLHPDEPGRARWESYTHNDTAHAWVIRHREGDRPWLVLHHGASMGWSLADLTVFRAATLHHDLQLNLVFPVMPFHGPRAHRSPLALQLPVEDPVDTVHAIAQAVWDTRRLLSWIRSQSDQPIGIHGLSLGTHPAALVAALDPNLASVTAGIPAAALTDLYVRHMPARLRRRTSTSNIVAEARTLLRVVSPLSVEPLIPRERRFIYAAIHDRVTDPEAQAQRLWAHWDEPEIQWFRGGHSGVIWSPDVASFVRNSLATSGLLESAA